ncbi:MAG: GNAT family N-acetyltransferase [Proteobacteria bacterium]|nr:GNAT family N-acetyltransferase [Pseudomonadota bacterium]
MNAKVQIRRAVPRDADAVARLSAQAAAEDDVMTVLDAERIRQNGFGQHAMFEAWVAQERANAPLIAHAIITKGYDIRRACPSIVLCDLYVAPEHRRAGLARRMMSEVARRARQLGARELAITTGVKNEVAQRFFAAVGAKPQQAALFMMSADGIEWLAAESL